MRTTVTLDEDVYKALDELRRERGLGTSAALNELVRWGLAAEKTSSSSRFTQRTSSMGKPRIPMDDIGETLEILEGEDHR